MKTVKDYEQEFADLYRKTADAELVFIKAFNKWAKLRKQLNSAERRYMRAMDRPAKNDWTDLAAADDAPGPDTPALLELQGQERLF